MAVTASQVKELREKTGVGMMECKKALTENAGDIDKAIVWLRERGLSRASKKAGRVAAEGLVTVKVADNGLTGAIVEVNCETDFVTKNDEFVAFVEDVAQLALAKGIESVDVLKEAELTPGKTVASTLTDLIAKIGENMSLRRLAHVKLEGNGLICGYVHLGGKIGSLVTLANTKADAVQEFGKDVAMHIAACAPKYLDRTEVPAGDLDQEREIIEKKLKEEGKPEAMLAKIAEGQLGKFYKETCLVDQPFVKDPKASVSQKLSEIDASAKVANFYRFQLGEGIEKKVENFADEVAAQLKQ